jgi:hypothetical protein
LAQHINKQLIGEIDMTTTTLFDKTVCLSVTFRAPCYNRKGDLNKIETKSDKSELGLTKRIFDSNAYRANRALRSKTKKWLEARSLPSPLRGGTYLIPASLLDDVNAYLDQAIEEYDKTADAFAAEYPDIIKKWQEKLVDQFNPSDYPSVKSIRKRFRVDRMVLNFNLTGDVDQQQELENALNEIRYALRDGLLQLVTRLAAMLEEDSDGKKETIQQRINRKVQRMDVVASRSFGC